MDIKAKLALLKQAAGAVEEKFNARKTAPQKPANIEPVLPSSFFTDETPFGTAYYRDTDFSVTHRHGNVRLSESVETPPQIISFLSGDPAMELLNIEKSAFIDTETTGLAGGTGTVAFLVGVGFFKGKSFVVRQYFMPDYKCEAPMLFHLQQMLKGFDSIVTYNGKAFDWPLLTTRMIMNRLKPENAAPLHLDLLFPARRLWKCTVGSCRLSSLEGSVIGFHRHDDIPGHMIPEIYFEFTRSKNFNTMEKVLEHNLNDIISMAALLVRMWEHLEMGRSGMLRHWGDFFSLGRIYEDRHEPETAAKYYEKALQCNVTGENRLLILKRLSVINRKSGIWAGAVSQWQEMLRINPGDVWALVEMAKYCEHHSGELQKAGEFTIAAGDILKKQKRYGSSGTVFRNIALLEHRLLRIRNKINKTRPDERKAP